MFTNKLECSCDFLLHSRNCCNMGRLILLFYGVIRDLYWEHLVVLGRKSCSFRREVTLVFDYVSEHTVEKENMLYV